MSESVAKVKGLIAASKILGSYCAIYAATYAAVAGGLPGEFVDYQAGESCPGP